MFEVSSMREIDYCRLTYVKLVDGVVERDDVPGFEDLVTGCPASQRVCEDNRERLCMAYEGWPVRLPGRQPNFLILDM